MSKNVVLTNEDVRVVSFVSRPFQDSESAYESVERDLKVKLKTVIGDDPNIQLTKISELNPFHVNSPQDIEARKDDLLFTEYLKTWDDDTLCRVTCTTEDVSLDDDGDLSMLPKEFIFKYYVRSYDDGMKLPENALIDVASSTLQ